MHYGRFFAMIATSTVVMFGLMYLNTYLLSHVYWSETRAWMALVMGAAMAIIMLASMLGMYRNRTLNIAIFAGAALVFAGALFLVRSQATVGDRAYMSAMIPHHSIAIMTSSRANISDPRVRKLADEIVYAQDKEIAEMRWLIADIRENGDGTEDEAPMPAIVSLDEALSTAERPALDPEFLSEDDLVQLFPEGPDCTFTYTETSPPALATGDVDGETVGLMKISGDLVRLDGGADGRSFGIGDLSVTLSGAGGPDLEVEADMVLTLGDALRVGYRGHRECGA